MLVLSFLLVLAPSTLREEPQPIFPPASAELRLAKGATLLQMLESYSELTGQPLVIPDDVRERLAQKTVDLLKDAVVPKERVQGFVEGILEDRGCGVFPGDYNNDFCVFDEETAELPYVVDYYESIHWRLPELKQHRALLVRSSFSPRLTSQLVWLLRGLKADSRLGGAQFEEDGGKVLLTGFASHFAGHLGFVRNSIQGSDDDLAGFLNTAAPADDDSEASGSDLVIDDLDENLLELVRRCSTHAELHLTIAPYQRTQLAKLPAGLLESVTLAAGDSREFVESLLLLNGFGVRELQPGRDALLAADFLGPMSTDADSWDARSFQGSTITANTGPATQCFATLDLSSLSGYQVPATLRPFYGPLERFKIIGNEERVLLGGVGLYVSNLTKLLYSIDAADGGAVDLTRFGLEPGVAFALPAEDLVFDEGDTSLLDLARLYSGLIGAVIWASPNATAVMQAEPMRAVPFRVLKEDVHAFVSSQFFGRELSFSRLPTTPPILAVTAIRESGMPAIVDAGRLPEFEELSPLQVTTVVALTTPRSSFKVPALSRVALSNDWYNTCVVNVAASNVILVKGPVSFVGPFVEELRRQDQTGEISLEAWSAFGERMDSR